MTVQQAIERADQMRQGNTVPDELKLEWLSECEGYIWDESIRMHFGAHRYRRYRETERNEYISSDWNGDFSSANAPDVIYESTEGSSEARMYKLYDDITATPDEEYPYGIDLSRVNVKYTNTIDGTDSIAPLSEFITCEYGEIETVVAGKIYAQTYGNNSLNFSVLYCLEPYDYVVDEETISLEKGVYTVATKIEDEDTIILAPIPVEEIIDEKIRTEIIPAWKYTEEDTDAELIAYAPYDMLYVYWLMAKIDLFSQEFDNYNTSITLFLNEKQQFKNHYHTHNRTIPNPQIRV